MIFLLLRSKNISGFPTLDYFFLDYLLFYSLLPFSVAAKGVVCAWETNRSQVVWGLQVPVMEFLCVETTF